MTLQQQVFMQTMTASKPEVIDVEMQDDPSIPFENIADTEMGPGFFEGEAPMEVEQGVVEGKAVGMNLGDDLPRMGIRVADACA